MGILWSSAYRAVSVEGGEAGRLAGFGAGISPCIATRPATAGGRTAGRLLAASE